MNPQLPAILPPEYAGTPVVGKRRRLPYNSPINYEKQEDTGVAIKDFVPLNLNPKRTDEEYDKDMNTLAKEFENINGEHHKAQIKANALLAGRRPLLTFLKSGFKTFIKRFCVEVVDATTASGRKQNVKYVTNTNDYFRTKINGLPDSSANNEIVNTYFNSF